MKSYDKLEAESFKKAHYFFLGKNVRKTIAKLDKNLPYFSIKPDGKFEGKEIIYDVRSNMLANAGLVLSKQYEDGKAFFKVRKISTLPGGFKRPSQKFELAEVSENEAPKDFPVQIANAISNSFSGVFTIDLVSVVRQTIPKIAIDVTGRRYQIYGGTGYKAALLCEKAVYRDLETNKKVKRVGFTLKLPKEERCEEENKKILEAISHYCQELIYYQESRFEIAQRLLHPKPVETANKEDDESDKEGK